MNAVHGFTVLYDPACPLCRWLRLWLAGQEQLVPLRFVAAGSAEAKHRFPTIDAVKSTEELHVVDDRGGLYLGEPAYVAVLWALADHRGTANLISKGPLRGLAKKTLALLSKYRPRDVCTSPACRV
jgi:predicted DCC family thiol-disulfide oxidoreductase YuxK